jgi:hypothetical protein
MRRFLLLPVICVVLLGSNGCSESNESLAAEAIAILKDIADELSTIKDPPSAEAAKPQLKTLGDRWRDNQRRRSKSKTMSSREMAVLERKYGPQLESALKRYLAEVARVRRIEDGEDALNELGDIKGHPQFPKK